MPFHTRAHQAAPATLALVVFFGRAFQQSALSIWAGKEVNVVPEQQALLLRARLNRAARLVEYCSEPETE